MKLLCLAIAFALVGTSIPLPAQAAVQHYQLNIPRQSLDSALKEFAKQTGLQVARFTDTGATADVGPLDGKLTVEQALRALLAESGLTWRMVNERTIAVVKTRSDSSELDEHVPGRDSTASAVQEEGSFTSGNHKKSFWGRLRIAQVDQSKRDETPVPSERRTQSSSNGSEERAFEEVVVTAQKREERLDNVPISISVLSGEALDKSSYLSMIDALRSVPGVAMYESGQGGMNKIAIRGVTSNVSLFNGSSTVGYYLDDIPFAFVRFPVTPNTNAYDLERIEVLRGPQGTLYGASSLNGVVRVLTQDADLDAFETKARATGSMTPDGGENYRVDAALNAPLIPGKLAVRGVVGYADNSGWIDLPAAGTKDVNEGLEKDLRLKVNAAPTENLDVELMTWFSRHDRDGSATSRIDRTHLAGRPEYTKNEYDAYGLTLTYDLPAMSILSATNHIKYFGSTESNNPLGDPNYALITRLFGELTSQEVRLSSLSTGPWKWSAGAIYRDEKDRTWQDFTSPIPPAGLVGIADNVYQSKSVAIFGELSKSFLDNRWELTGGLRYFADDSSSNERSVFTPDPPFGVRKEDFDALTPRVVLAFRPTDRANYYVSYAQGFRSGFAQNGQVLRLSGGAVPAVDPDRLSNYEIGTKGAVLDGRVSYDLSAYYIDWKDTVQVAGIRIGTETFFGALNSKGVAGPGVDAAVTLRFTDRLDFTGSISWNDLAFVDDVFSGVALLYPEDSRPPDSSETTAGAALNYTMPLPGAFSGRFSGAVDYLSKMLTPGISAATNLVGDDLLIARSSFTLVSPTRWSTMLFVDNLTDEDGARRPLLLPSQLSTGVSDRLRPRTFGLQVDFRF